ncbi:MAG TPA: PilZ domain-containing protein [candidate division Zixibacteria bacterium]|nr:PilZ domain-containing protein [candidate division Zixibacteria bacterium]
MNKRMLDRKKTGVFFGIYERDNSKYFARLVDLNTKGLMVIGKKQLNPNDTFKLKMDLPQEMCGKSQIEFDAQVKWSEKSKNTKLFTAGLEFTRIAPEYSQLIDKLIANPVFNDPAGALPFSVNVESHK